MIIKACNGLFLSRFGGLGEKLMSILYLSLWSILSLNSTELTPGNREHRPLDGRKRRCWKVNRCPRPGRPDLYVDPAPSTEPAPAPRRAPDVEPGVLVGEITALRHDTASINLGRAQGLTPGIELPVRRGALRIATLQIERVEIVSAAGILIDQEFSPRRGDVVLFEPPVESDGE